MGDFNDDIWGATPTRPWQEGLDDASLLDPLLATPHHPDVGQYYSCIPRHGERRRLDAILVHQQIPNIPWTYHYVIRMPIYDHSLVLLGLKWCTGGHITKPPPPQLSVARWYTPHFQKFTTQMASLGSCDTQAPLMRARLILSAIARAARPWSTRNNQTTSPVG